MLEPEPVLLRALEHGLGPSPALAGRRAGDVSGDGPVAAIRDGGGYDIIDLSADFLDAAEANATAFTRAGDRRLPARAGAGRDRVDPGVDPRFPGLCAAHAGDRAGGAAARRASAIRRRT